MMKQTDIIEKKEYQINRHILTVVLYVYRTNEIGEWPIIRSNELKIRYT